MVPQGRNPSRSTMGRSLPSPPRPSDNFYDIVEVANPPAMQMKFARRVESNADALFGPGGYEIIILRDESQELSTRTYFLKKWHAANSKPWSEMCVMHYSIKKSTIPNRSPRTPKTGKRCRQSKCAGIFRKVQSSHDAKKTKCPESI